MKVKIKICGLTRKTDIRAAIAAGVDAIGLVLVPESPRYVSIAKAQELAAEVPANVHLVGLFMDADAKIVAESCRQLPLSALQFHGAETNDFASGFGLPWMKTIAMGEQLHADGGSSVNIHAWPAACALLFDANRPGQQGGQGEVFDWNRMPQISQKLVLAGGLNSDNVGTAIKQLRPWAVDVSSGVETTPGHKDKELILRFCNAVRAASV